MPAPSAPSAPRQRRFDDLGTPLHDVTFCVIDLETTGASRQLDAITEVAAVRYRGGERLDSLVTLVNPGVPIPPTITYLTGITEDMVGPAPGIAPVLAALQELIRPDDVIVGHNVAFDVGFLDAALTRHGWPRLGRRTVDTVRLARRVLAGEVPDCRLGTLATWLGLPHQPCHRALADVEATADLLHLLLERVAGLGITGLDDLLSLPTIGGHPEAPKLALTAALPRRPGVYLFRDRGGTVVYVGKATNLRARVRQYFGHDDRRKVGPLLHVTHRIDHVECSSPLHAAVLEVRLIRRHRPRFNDVAAHPEAMAYLRVGGTAGRPRLTVTRRAEPTAGTWLLGPFSGPGSARAAAVALTEGCAALGPSVGLDPPTVLDRPDQLLSGHAEHLLELAQQERFEDAARARDRAATLARALTRQRRAEELLRLGTLELVWCAPSGPVPIRLRHGALSIDDAHLDTARLPVSVTADDLQGRARAWEPGPVPCLMADELAAVVSFLDRHGGRLTVTALEAPSGADGLAWPARRPPSFDPRRSPARRPGQPGGEPVDGTAAPGRPAVTRVPGGAPDMERALLPLPHGHRAGAADRRRSPRRARRGRSGGDGAGLEPPAPPVARGPARALQCTLPLDGQP